MGLVFENILAIVPNGEYCHCTVYVEGERIVAIGGEPEGFVRERVIDGAGKLLTPGLVNAHAHAYMTAFRNQADDLDFHTWLFETILPMEDKLTAQEAYYGCELTCQELLSQGVTSFLDMHMFPMQSVLASEKFGMRAVISRGLSSGNPACAERRLREALDEIDAAKGCKNVSFMLAPHACYSCDEGYLKEVSQTAKAHGLGINTHMSESIGEVDGCFEKTGCSPVEFYDRCGILSESTVAAHCVHLSENDMDIIAARGISVASNPVSNLKLANGIAPIPELTKRGVNVCLGTDSSASNNSLSILRELSFMTLLHKGVSGDATAVSAREGFLMATKNGARALGYTDLGEIREGYLADLAVFSLDRPSLTPLGDPYAALSYSNAGLAAYMTVVGGKIVYESGKFNV